MKQFVFKEHSSHLNIYSSKDVKSYILQTGMQLKQNMFLLSVLISKSVEAAEFAASFIFVSCQEAALYGTGRLGDQRAFASIFFFFS